MDYRWVECVVDGKPERRQLDHYEVGDQLLPAGMHPGLALAYPVMNPGERIEWLLGDARPHIFTERTYPNER